MHQQELPRPPSWPCYRSKRPPAPNMANKQDTKDEYVPEAGAEEGGGGGLGTLLSMLPWPFNLLGSRSVRMVVLGMVIMLNKSETFTDWWNAKPPGPPPPSRRGSSKTAKSQASNDLDLLITQQQLMSTEWEWNRRAKVRFHAPARGGKMAKFWAPTADCEEGLCMWTMDATGRIRIKWGDAGWHTLKATSRTRMQGTNDETGKSCSATFAGEFEEQLEDLDLYAILGVEPEADSGAIRRAFRKHSLNSHPDKARRERLACRTDRARRTRRTHCTCCTHLTSCSLQCACDARPLESLYLHALGTPGPNCYLLL